MATLRGRIVPRKRTTAAIRLDPSQPRRQPPAGGGPSGVGRAGAVSPTDWRA